MKKRTEALNRVFALRGDAAHIEGDVAQTVLETNPLIGRPARRSRRALIIGRPTRGYIALYRYVSEIDTVFILGLRSRREAGYKRV